MIPDEELHFGPMNPDPSEAVTEYRTNLMHLQPSGHQVISVTPCPPAPPPSASPAAETSSGGERCTVGGAYCYDMRRFVEHPAVDLSSEGLELYGHRDSEAFPHMKLCPWCGEKLGGEG